MNEPLCPQTSPIALELEPGRYWWCTCGRSTRQPFCDGSHRDTPFLPLAFEIEATTKVWLCACKRTRTMPYCDGSHKRL